MAKITCAEALAYIQKGIAYAEANGYAMAFAVVDAGGHPLAMAKMDTASILAGEAVIQKARAAAWLGKPTTTAVMTGKDWPHVYLSFAIASQGQITLSMGGLPIVRDGEIVGAIGSAGGTGAQDEACSAAAIAAD